MFFKSKLFFQALLILFYVCAFFSATAHAEEIQFDHATNWDIYLSDKYTNSSNKIKINNKSPLWNHVQFFATKEGVLTEKTMKTPHDLLGIYKNVKYKIKAIFDMLDRRNYAYHTDKLVTIYNPASTGLWDNFGEFNEAKFQQLSSMALNHKGHKIITKKIFMEFLNSQPRDGREKEVAATVTIFWPFKVNITWQQVTQGSIDELFGYLARYQYKDEKAFSLADLKYFYQYPDKYMHEIIDSKRAILKQKISACPFRGYLT